MKGVQHDFGAAKASYRGQALDFINAVSYLRSASDAHGSGRVGRAGLTCAPAPTHCSATVPLTFVNAFVIIIKLVFG